MKKIDKNDIELIKLAEKGGNDAHLFVLDKLNKAINDIALIRAGAEQRIDIVSENIKFLADKLETIKWKKGDKGDTGKKGDKGERGKEGKQGLKGMDGVDGSDGKDGADGKDGLNGADGSADTPEMIRDKLEFLRGEERLDVSAIKGLRTKLYDLGKQNVGGASGFNYSAIDVHTVDDETPGGTVNGSNKAFTLNHSPSPTTSLKVYVNGMRMRITEDWTLSGQTITFNTAPPQNSIILVDYRI